MEERALAMGKLIASKSPVAVVSTKHLMNRELTSILGGCDADDRRSGSYVCPFFGGY